MSPLETVVTIALGGAALLAAGLLALAWLILRTAVTKEIEAVLPILMTWLLRRARDKLPEEERDRWEEEWGAGFGPAMETRPIWGFREALCLYLSAARVARTLESVSVRQRGLGRLREFRGSIVARAEDFQRALIARVIAGAIAGCVGNLTSISRKPSGEFVRLSGCPTIKPTDEPLASASPPRSRSPLGARPYDAPNRRRRPGSDRPLGAHARNGWLRRRARRHLPWWT